MRIAVIADVHGNLAALEAVMADIAAAAPDVTVNLGDLISGPFDPAGSADAQMAAGYVTIAGNHERQLLDESQGALDVLSRPLLSPEHWSWLRSLPPTRPNGAAAPGALSTARMNRIWRMSRARCVQ